MASEPLPHLETPALTNHTFAAPRCEPKNTDARDAWNKIIDEDLVAWRQHPELLEDDGVDAPSGAAIAAASKVSSLLRDQGAPVPTNFSPTGDGGIGFHYEHGDVLLTIEFDVEGHRELRFYFGGQFVRLDENNGPEINPIVDPGPAHVEKHGLDPRRQLAKRNSRRRA